MQSLIQLRAAANVQRFVENFQNKPVCYELTVTFLNSIVLFIHSVLLPFHAYIFAESCDVVLELLYGLKLIWVLTQHTLFQYSSISEEVCDMQAVDTVGHRIEFLLHFVITQKCSSMASHLTVCIIIFLFGFSLKTRSATCLRWTTAAHVQCASTPSVQVRIFTAALQQRSTSHSIHNVISLDADTADSAAVLLVCNHALHCDCFAKCRLEVCPGAYT